MSVYGYKSQFSLPADRKRRSRDRQDGRRDLGPDGKPSRLGWAAARHFDQSDGGADPTPEWSGRSTEIGTPISQQARDQRFWVYSPLRTGIGSFAPDVGRSGRCGPALESGRWVSRRSKVAATWSQSFHRFARWAGSSDCSDWSGLHFSWRG